MTVTEYTKLLRQSEVNEYSLLSEHEEDLRRDSSVSNSVLWTWRISSDYIRGKRPAAANLLAQMSMLDRSGIPEDLLCNKSKPSLEFEIAITTLLQYALTKEEQDRKSFVVHRLVQLATRLWVEALGETQHVQQRILGSLNRFYLQPLQQHVWKRYELLEPHAELILNRIYAQRDCQAQQGLMLFWNAEFAFETGNFCKTEARLEKAVEIWLGFVGPEDINILKCQPFFIKIYLETGRLATAETNQALMVEKMRSNLGPQHVETLVHLGGLGSVYVRSGQFEKAETLQVIVMRSMTDTLGREDRLTLNAMNNLAITYGKQGRLQKAVELQLAVLEGNRKAFGHGSLQTIRAMANLADMYVNQFDGIRRRNC